MYRKSIGTESSNGLGSLPVDFGGAKASDGVAEIEGVSLAEVVLREDGSLCVGVGGEDVAAVNAGEQATVYGRGEEAAVFLNEYVVDGGLGDLAVLIQKE